jgi:hypothetical protein
VCDNVCQIKENFLKIFRLKETKVRKSIARE